MTSEKATRGDAHPFVGFDVATLLALQEQLHGSRVFLTWVPTDGPETPMTYAAFVHTVRHVAAAMRRRGIRKRDRVLIHLENCPEAVVSWFACAWLGATAVVTNARAAPAELAYFARHSGVVAAITQPKFLADVSGPVPASPGLR